MNEFQGILDLATLSNTEVLSRIVEITDKLRFGFQNGASKELLSDLAQDRRACQAELALRNEKPKPSKQQDFWPAPIELTEFFDKTVAEELWLWEDALPYGATSQIAGQPRTGKSTLALNLCLAIARGARFLNRDTLQSPVLYLNIDNSDNEFRAMLNRLNAIKTDRIYLHNGKVPDRRVDWLTDQCLKRDIKFIVIDTLQRFYDIRNINDGAECVDKMSPLDLRVKELGLHVMYLHHAGKGDPRTGDPTQTAALGSITLKGMTPWYFQFSRVGTGQRILSSDFRGGKNFDQTFIEQDRKSGWCVVGGNLEDAFISDVVPRILDVLDDEGQATEGQLQGAIEARAIIVAKAIRRLFNDDQISRSGTGKRGDPFKYFRSLSLGTESKNGLGTESGNVRQIRDYIGKD